MKCPEKLNKSQRWLLTNPKRVNKTTIVQKQKISAPARQPGALFNFNKVSYNTFAMNKYKPVTLIVLDGWGERNDFKDNAIAAAKKPFYDLLIQKYPHSLLEASGRAVGLPEGQMGNSEVGHTTIGAGRVIANDLVRISDAISMDDFVKNSAFIRLFDHVKKNNSALHVCGLVSVGGVHSHIEHLKAFLKTAKEAGVSKIFVHVFTDGRDTAPQSAYEYILDLENYMVAEPGVGRIATISGRFYAMDRDNNWDRLKPVENMIFEGIGQKAQSSKASDLVKKLYSEGQFDERFEPFVLPNVQGEADAIKDNDGIFFFNFRADRARMLSSKILERQSKQNFYFVTMTEYDKNFTADVAFAPQEIQTTLATEVSLACLTQSHIAETEKFPHATYFLNGGRQEPHEGESHILVPSRKDVKTHDLAPKMMAKEIADKAVEEIEKGIDFLFVNFANADMVGHTAQVPAIIESLEAVDGELKKVVEATIGKGGIAVVTADHGNAELNVDQETGEMHTAHTLNPVPFIVTDSSLKVIGGTLADVAPTVLELLNLNKPVSMTGKSLFIK